VVKSSKLSRFAPAGYGSMKYREIEKDLKKESTNKRDEW
jgi:hypothetical protein